MISVLIVDDEYLIRSLIRNSIPWAEHGMEVVGEAGDGEQALAFIEQYHPQVALVDINMPILNGLELAQLVRERNCRTNIILLTGYRDFSYARQAVTYQVFDYLLKPLSVDETVAVLDRLRQKLEMERQLSCYVKDMERRGDKGQQLLQERFLHRLAFGHAPQSTQKTAQELKRLEIPLRPEGLLAMVAEISVSADDSDDGLYVYAVHNILSELLREDAAFSNVTGFSEVDNCVVILCNAAPEAQGAVRRAWQTLSQTVQKHFPFSICGGVSRRFSGFDAIGMAVHEAMEAIGGRFYSQDGTLFFAGCSGRTTGLRGVFASADFESLQMYVNAGQWEAGAEAIRMMFRQMREQQLQESFCRMAGMGLLAVLYSLSAKYQIPGSAVSSGNRPAAEQIETCQTCGELETLLLDCYARLSEQIRKTRPVSKLVHAALAYIQGNFCSSELSLGTIAASVYATPAYVSSLFKKELGISVTEYITASRMKKASELMLEDPGLSLNAVSEQVGYTDPYYFSRCFKKHYGVTPSKYLSNHTQPAAESLKQ